MFSPEIVGSEEFKTMPMSSQALYFHLGMDADDDGFIQPKLLMRAIGFTDDDLKVLLAKRFLLQFGNGVVAIKHWLIHNMIRSDRYKPTRYVEEKNSLFIKENKAYTDRQPNGNQMAPQVRLGEVSKGNTSEIKISQIIEITPEEEKEPRKRQDTAYREIFDLWGKYPLSWRTNRSMIQAAKNLLASRSRQDLVDALDFAKKHANDGFCPQILSPWDLDSKWEKLVAYSLKK